MKVMNLFFLLLFAVSAMAQKSDTVDSSDMVYMVVESPPEFEGGVDAMKAFVARNVKYPRDAYKKGISGTVFVQFIIDKDGNVTEEKVIRGIGKSCDKEALRVIKMMPKWKPGKQQGKRVRVRFVYPFNFSLR
jgi:periplasmic protein TonB